MHDLPLPISLEDAIEEIQYLRKALMHANEKIAAKVMQKELLRRSMLGEIKALRAKLELAKGIEGENCQCQFEVGDSPCRVHGKNDE